MSLTWIPLLESALRDLAYKQGDFIAPQSRCMITEGPEAAHFEDGSELDTIHYIVNAILYNQFSQTCDERAFLLPSALPQESLSNYSFQFDSSTGIFHVASRFRYVTLKELFLLRTAASPAGSIPVVEFSNGEVLAVPLHDGAGTDNQGNITQDTSQAYGPIYKYKIQQERSENLPDCIAADSLSIEARKPFQEKGARLTIDALASMQNILLDSAPQTQPSSSESPNETISTPATSATLPEFPLALNSLNLTAPDGQTFRTVVEPLGGDAVRMNMMLVTRSAVQDLPFFHVDATDASFCYEALDLGSPVHYEKLDEPLASLDLAPPKWKQMAYAIQKKFALALPDSPNVEIALDETSGELYLQSVPLKFPSQSSFDMLDLDVIFGEDDDLDFAPVHPTVKGAVAIREAPSPSDWYLQALGGDCQYREHRRVEVECPEDDVSGYGDGMVHHINFNNQPVNQRSYTPPEVSFWAAATTYDKVFVQKPSLPPKDEIVRLKPLPAVHVARVLATQAFKWVDPIKYTGNNIFALWDKKGSAMRNAATSDVHVVYQQVGTWNLDQFTEDDAIPKIAPNDLNYEYATNGNYRFLQLPHHVDDSSDDHRLVHLNVGNQPKAHFHSYGTQIRSPTSLLQYELGAELARKAALLEERLEKKTSLRSPVSFLDTVEEEVSDAGEDANAAHEDDASEAATDVQDEFDPNREPQEFIQLTGEADGEASAGSDEPIVSEAKNISEAAVGVQDRLSLGPEHVSFLQSSTEPQDEAVISTHHERTNTARGLTAVAQKPKDPDVEGEINAGRDAIAGSRKPRSRISTEDSRNVVIPHEEDEKESLDGDNGITDHSSVWAKRSDRVAHPKANFPARFCEDKKTFLSEESKTDLLSRFREKEKTTSSKAPGNGFAAQGSRPSEQNDIEIDPESQFVPRASHGGNAMIALEDGRHCSPSKMVHSSMDVIRTPAQSPFKADDLGSWNLNEFGVYETPRGPEVEIAPHSTSSTESCSSDQLLRGRRDNGDVLGSEEQPEDLEEKRFDGVSKTLDKEDSFLQSGSASPDYKRVPHQPPIREGGSETDTSPVKSRKVLAKTAVPRLFPGVSFLQDIQVLDTNPNVTNEEFEEVLLETLAQQEKKQSGMTVLYDPETAEYHVSPQGDLFIQTDHTDSAKHHQESPKSGEESSSTTSGPQSRKSSGQYSAQTLPSSLDGKDTLFTENTPNSFKMPGKLNIDETSPEWKPLAHCWKHISVAVKGLSRNNREFGILAATTPRPDAPCRVTLHAHQLRPRYGAMAIAIGHFAVESGESMSSSIPGVGTTQACGRPPRPKDESQPAKKAKASCAVTDDAVERDDVEGRDQSGEASNGDHKTGCGPH